MLFNTARLNHQFDLLKHIFNFAFIVPHWHFKKIIHCIDTKLWYSIHFVFKVQ